MTKEKIIKAETIQKITDYIDKELTIANSEMQSSENPLCFIRKTGEIEALLKLKGKYQYIVSAIYESEAKAQREIADNSKKDQKIKIKNKIRKISAEN